MTYPQLAHWIEFVALRWWMVGFYTLVGVWLIWSRECLGSVCTMVPRIRDDETAQERLHRALLARDDREAFPATVGMAIGVCPLVAALVSATTPVPLALPYAALAIVLALGLFAGYVRLRRVRGPRAASLRLRHPWDVIPWYALVALAAVALLPLVQIDRAPVAAVLVSAAALLILATAWKVAALPALVGSDDVSVELFVDERVRAVRVISLLGTSTAPVYVFFGLGVLHATRTDVVAMLCSLTALVVMAGWQIAVMRRPAMAREIASWSMPPQHA